MANPWAGEVALVMDGERHVLKLTLGALAELEDGLNTGGLVELVERFESGAFASRDVIALLLAGLRGGGWRELLSGAGVKTAAISGAGVFKDEGTDERARQIFFDGEIPDFQVIIPGFGTIEGPFQVAALEYAGTHNGEATYELSLASAGVLTSVAA